MRGLNEIVPVADVFCSGLGAIERLEGGCLRLYFYVTQAAYDGEASEKLVVAKLVVPATAVPDALLRLIAVGGDNLTKAIPLAPEMTH